MPLIMLNHGFCLSVDDAWVLEDSCLSFPGRRVCRAAPLSFSCASTCSSIPVFSSTACAPCALTLTMIVKVKVRSSTMCCDICAHCYSPCRCLRARRCIAFLSSGRRVVDASLWLRSSSTSMLMTRCVLVVVIHDTALTDPPSMLAFDSRPRMHASLCTTDHAH